METVDTTQESPEFSFDETTEERTYVSEAEVFLAKLRTLQDGDFEKENAVDEVKNLLDTLVEDFPEVIRATSHKAFREGSAQGTDYMSYRINTVRSPYEK